MILSGARYVESPNCRPRKGESKGEGVEVDCIVLHYISLPPGQFGTGCVERFFTNTLDWKEHPYFKEIEGFEVSAHFLLLRDGALVQFVDTGLVAYHAGKSRWRGREEVNDFSIGIELEGAKDVPFTDEQYGALAGLVRELMRVHPSISIDNIVGHEDVAPGRKEDPGELFDWERLRRGIGRTENA